MAPQRSVDKAYRSGVDVNSTSSSRNKLKEGDDKNEHIETLLKSGVRDNGHLFQDMSGGQKRTRM